METTPAPAPASPDQAYLEVLQLARRTLLNREHIRRLSRSLSRLDDLAPLLRHLPLRAIEPFSLAAHRLGRPLPLAAVAPYLGQLGDPFSSVRLVVATSGDRIEALLDQLEHGAHTPFLRSVFLFLGALLQGAKAPSPRWVTRVLAATEERNSWMSGVLLRDIAERLESAELLRATRTWAPERRTPAGRLVVDRLRASFFEPPLTQIPEREPYGSETVSLNLAPSEVRALTLPLRQPSQTNFETLDTVHLNLVLDLLAQAGLRDQAAHAKTELRQRRQLEVSPTRDAS